MGIESQFHDTMVAIREHRANLRESAVRQMDLLSRLGRECEALRATADFKDPVTAEPILVFHSVPVHDRGASFTMSALDGKYAASLEVYYAYGDRIGSAVKCADDDDQREAFYVDVFSAMPLRLDSLDGDSVVLFLRGSVHDSGSIDIPTLLLRFVQAVLKREHLGT
jgi:hypothetical protein